MSGDENTAFVCLFGLEFVVRCLLFSGTSSFDLQVSGHSLPGRKCADANNNHLPLQVTGSKKQSS